MEDIHECSADELDDVLIKDAYEADKDASLTSNSEKCFHIIPELSVKGVHRLKDNSVDIIFIDGDHSYEAVK